MDRLAQINRILDSCLTTDTLDLVYPQTKALEEVLLSPEEIQERHKTVRIDLLSFVGRLVEAETEQIVQGNEIGLLMERVDRFLHFRGFNFK